MRDLKRLGIALGPCKAVGGGTMMPLSEHEQRALDELGRQLASEDPAFTDRLDTPGRLRLRLTLSIGGLVLGLGLLTLFCTTTYIGFGVAAFLVLFGSLYLLWLSLSEKVSRATADARVAVLRSRRRSNP